MWEGRSAAATGLDGSLGWTRVAATALRLNSGQECASHIEEKRRGYYPSRNTLLFAVYS
jgi:hypothetical protein